MSSPVRTAEIECQDGETGLTASVPPRPRVKGYGPECPRQGVGVCGRVAMAGYPDPRRVGVAPRGIAGR
jgi:hypothetical protein